MMMKKLTTIFILSLLWVHAYGQKNDSTTVFAQQTFNSPLGFNYQSAETQNKSTLAFYLGHRFGQVSSGYYDFFGLDEFSSWRLGFDYGITKDLTVGIGRSSLDKYHDGHLKYKVLKQSTGKKNMPITLTVLGGVGINAVQYEDERQDAIEFKHRMSYSLSLFVARQFSPALSAQLSPVLIHQNATQMAEQNNTSLALGGLVKWKVSRVTSVVTEYMHNLSYDIEGENYFGSIAVGVDFSTFSHNFSLFLTNNVYMVDSQSIPRNHGNFFGNEIHIGFNISRRFIL